MILDSFIFNDELDILEFRMQLLLYKVDRFIIVESDRTFTGDKKPFHFNDNKNKFRWAEDKIEHYMFSPNVEGLDFMTKPTEYDPSHDCWKVEYQQRNAIMDIANHYPDSSILILSDCDEIPSHEAIELAKESQLPLACQQELFYYNLKNYCNQDWRGTIFSTVDQARTITPQGLRDMRNVLPAISNGGWHLSWFGDISKKLNCTSHQEFNNPEFNNPNHIKRCVEQKKDLFNRNIDFMEVGEWFFPEYFNRKLKGRFNG